jgi:hypothetical protein
MLTLILRNSDASPLHQKFNQIFIVRFYCPDIPDTGDQPGNGKQEKEFERNQIEANKNHQKAAPERTIQKPYRPEKNP